MILHIDAFKHNNTALPVLRVRQKNSYITAAGIRLEEAAEHIQAVYGPNQIPKLLRIVDNLSKTKA